MLTSLLFLHARFDELIRTSDALRQFMVQVGSDNPAFQRGPAADRQYNCPITGEVMQEPCKEMEWLSGCVPSPPRFFC